MITCTILYPEHFDALRRTYDCEKTVIESLARCAKFNASGGKSGSAFLKTKGSFGVLFSCVISLKLYRRSVYRKRDLQSGARDDGDLRTCLFRLYVVILHCWSTFSSDNLIVRSSLMPFDQRPTLLAKIFGCFKVMWKTTSHSGPGKPKINQMNLVVMENLFYDRRFSKVSQSNFGFTYWEYLTET